MRGSDVWRERARWGGRGLLVLVFLVLVGRGASDFAHEFMPRPGPATSRADQALPRGEAEAMMAFAARFAMAYETYDAARPDEYGKALSRYLANGLDPALGWDGNGKQRANQALPVSYERRGSDVLLVTTAVEVDGGRWLYLAVPVAVKGGAYAVVDRPTLLPAPARADWTPPGAPISVDAQLTQALGPNLQAFFSAYANGDQAQLGYYSAPGTSFVGLGGQVAFGSLDSLKVAQGGSARNAWADVRWKDRSGAAQVQSYRLGLQQTNGKWLVSSVSPAGGDSR